MKATRSKFRRAHWTQRMTTLFKNANRSITVHAEPRDYEHCREKFVCVHVWMITQPSSGAGIRPSLQPSWSPLISFSFLFAVEELYGTRYQSGSFPWFMWGVVVTACAVFSFFNEKYMCHGIFILIRPNMFCVTLVGSVCVHILWEWRQQRNLKAVPKFVTSALVTKSRMRYMLFYIAEIGRFVSWGKTTPICSRHFSRTFRWFNVLCCFKSVIILFLISFPSRTLRFLSLYLILWIYLWLAGTSQQPIS